MAGVGDLRDAHVLDVGCGFADFADELRQRFPGVRYTGIDLSKRMVEEAKRLHPDVRILQANLLDLPTDERFDVVTANGIFYLLGGEGPRLMPTLVRRMFELAERAVAFNSLSTWAPSQEPDEFYADPLATVAFCRTLSPRVVLRHDYLSHDFTVYLYREASR